MRVQSQLLVLFVCLNAAMGMVTELSNLGIVNLFGSTGVDAPKSVGDAMVQYGDAPAIADDWSKKPPTVLGMIGDILGSIPWYFRIAMSGIAGFPILAVQLANAYALDPMGNAIVTIFVVGLTLVWGWLMASFIIELISGRFLNEG